MNGKLSHETTPEGRIAAAAVVHAAKMEDNHIKSGNGPARPDVADLREALRPYVQMELLRARLEEADRLLDSKSTRRTELVRELYFWESQIPRELRT